MQSEVVIAVSGSYYGAEAEAAKIAQKNGFTVIALAAAEFDPSDSLKRLDGVFQKANSGFMFQVFHWHGSLPFSHG